jgi:hypothetical protein
MQIATAHAMRTTCAQALNRVLPATITTLAPLATSYSPTAHAQEPSPMRTTMARVMQTISALVRKRELRATTTILAQPVM